MRVVLGYYNPNPGDKNLSEENIGGTPRSYLYEYVVKRTPNKTPRPTDRGVQIKNEFYPLATKILRKR